MIKIRPLVSGDIDKICAMPQSVEELYVFFPKASFPLTAEQLSSAVAQRSDSHVITEGEAVLGFANFYCWGMHERCSIGNVIVASNARGRGIASMLMKHMIELAYEKYCASEVTVSCFNFNVAGLLLYPKLGFKPYDVEERVGPVGNRVALVHMRYCKP
ncbi:GNAT family N-acetyltransferase [Billgrantia endophytica]|uniref:GNAT family N-acetyltransferase n=1 Tax=Billgrantia endophytica TaxID=2033802 RepID=A0A2N7UBW9_9GAMM|nr:GNAT family N-acetyltransferase [Halomonas endophytica]PMR77937.1 GNAT family N-acetyltransferase [Halomonas endophytica]